MGQHIDPRRYTVVPRTLIFLLQDAHVLLQRLPADHADWPGRLNGLGGHIEPGEDAASCAQRELQEEAGISDATLQLCGTVLIRLERAPGIAMFVFAGSPGEGIRVPPGSPLVWMPLASLPADDLVEDLPLLLPRVVAAYRGGKPFSALYQYDGQGRLQPHFAN